MIHVRHMKFLSRYTAQMASPWLPLLALSLLAQCAVVWSQSDPLANATILELWNKTTINVCTSQTTPSEYAAKWRMLIQRRCMDPVPHAVIFKS